MEIAELDEILRRIVRRVESLIKEGRRDEILNERFFHTALVDGVEYTYSLSARDEVPNWSPMTDPVTGVPMDTLPPDTPLNLRCIPVAAGNALYLEWTCDEEDVKGYRIFLLEDSTWIPLMNVTTTFATVENLTNGVEYILCVAAMDEVPNESGLSDSARGTPEDTLPPLVPSNLQARPGIEEAEIALQWTANEDDTISYTVERSNDGGSWEEIGSTNATTLIDSDRVLGTLYLYRVFATDDDGLASLPSGTVSAEPRDLTPPPPPIVDPVPEFLAVKELTVTGTTEPMATVEVLLEGIIRARGGADAAGRFGIQLDGIEEELHSLEVRALDKWNNTSPVSATTWFTVDTIAPSVVRIVPDPSNPLDSGIDLEVQLTEQCYNVSILLRSIDSPKEIQLSPLTTGNTPMLSIQIPASTKAGVYLIVITGSDRAGNEMEFNQEIHISSASNGNGFPIMLISITFAIIIIGGLILLIYRRGS